MTTHSEAAIGVVLGMRAFRRLELVEVNGPRFSELPPEGRETPGKCVYGKLGMPATPPAPKRWGAIAAGTWDGPSTGPERACPTLRLLPHVPVPGRPRSARFELGKEAGAIAVLGGVNIGPGLRCSARSWEVDGKYAFAPAQGACCWEESGAGKTAVELVLEAR